MTIQPSKLCPRCVSTKTHADFNRDARRHDGLQSRCRACEAVYRAANRERRAVRDAAYRATHREQYAASGKAYYTRNRKVRKAKNAAYHAANLSACMLRHARSRATSSGVPCTITREWIEERMHRGVCEATGLPLIIGGTDGLTPYSPSLDKLVPALGYTPGNTLLVCWGINALKQRDSDFGHALDFCRAVVEAAARPGPVVTEENT